jgi:hypothetical protein
VPVDGFHLYEAEYYHSLEMRKDLYDIIHVHVLNKVMSHLAKHVFTFKLRSFSFDGYYS